MPRFKIEYETSLKSTLKSMGIVSAFDSEKADFSALDDRRQNYIESVSHKATIEVDELGTEASAATEIKIYIASWGPSDEIEFYVDEPFFYTITTDKNDILFAGIYRN
ncbi:Proteinase inhibitor I4 serpin [Aphelenchoides besseyi]|nr:Proteinase inhibitor I4 serpin [Aphelenchoides besseyi]KAI6231476.1 Proteinase inhibitor I4 serpin [Aphelenchoides besseyi]